MNAIEVRDEILSWMNHVPPLNGCAVPSAGERGVIIGLMNNALKLGENMGTANHRRHQVLAWIFRDLLDKPNASWISAKDLNDEMWWSLVKWTEAHKNQETGSWVGREGFEESMYVCWRAMEDWEAEINGQLGFDI